jgi:TolB-like protein/Tfp pilus assembly protein PilF
MRGLLAELQRRKVYRAAAAYAVVAWLLIQIATQVFPFFDMPNWGVRLTVLLIVLGFPIAVAMAWAFDLTEGGIVRADPKGSSRARRSAIMIWAGLSLVVLAAYYFITREHAAASHAASGATAQQSSSPVPADAKSIAVLPFVDLSQNKDQEYFGDGISEELAGTLARVEGLRVAARTSSFSFKNTAIDVHLVGQKLNVGSVLEGSVRRDGQRIRVSAELIDATTGFDLWTQTYERNVDDLFAVQDQITHAIIEALKIKLAVAIPVRKSVDPEAYDLYLQGVFYSNKSSEEALRQSLDLFDRALRKQPDSADAWAGIAKDWNYLSDAYMRPLDAYPQSKAAALKAIEIDETNADAHAYLADAMRVLDRDIAASNAELRHALQLNPNSSQALMFLALNRATAGYPAEGIAYMQQAMKIDPLSPRISSFASLLYLGTGRYDDAVAAGLRTQSLDPTYVYLSPYLADVYREQGRYDEAIAIYRKAVQTTGEPQAGLAVTYARMGRTAEARRILAEFEDKAAKTYVSGDEIAMIYAALGDKNNAFRWLQRALDEHAAPLGGMGLALEFRPLRSDPRFAALLAKLGLDPQRVQAAYP